MTQGRFETIFNCRTPGWDERHFWAQGEDRKYDHRDYPCRCDHKQRESCPFHDLRADGCFQPERWGAGVGSTANMDAEGLFARKRGGKPFGTSFCRMHSNIGCGGLNLPVDTVPRAEERAKKYDARPWTSTRKLTDLFSRPPYMTVPPTENVVPPVEPPFRTSKTVEAMNSHYEHVPDAYGKRVTAERPAFRLKAGKVPFRLDPRLKFEPGAEAAEKVKKPRRAIPRGVYQQKKSQFGTFGRFPVYVSTPYSEPHLGSERRPIFTYHAQSKRPMPVLAPWSTGLSTAEPARPGTAPVASA